MYRAREVLANVFNPGVIGQRVGVRKRVQCVGMVRGTKEVFFPYKFHPVHLTRREQGSKGHHG